MAWLRIEDTVPEHPKLLRAGPAACWLWLCSIAYCQRQLTDGYIPDAALIHLGCPTDRRRLDNIYRLIPTLITVGLWEACEGGGYRVHDYHDYNDTRQEVMDRQELIREQRRKAGLASGRARRNYSQQTANGPVERLLNPIPSHPIPSPVQAQHLAIQTAKPSNGNGHGPLSVVVDPETAEEGLRMRAGALVERYKELFHLHRRGARYHSRPALDFPRALNLVRTWPDDTRLEKIAVIIITTDDEWITGTDRGFGVFEARASWADDRLSAWEAEHKH